MPLSQMFLSDMPLYMFVDLGCLMYKRPPLLMQLFERGHIFLAICAQVCGLGFAPPYRRSCLHGANVSSMDPHMILLQLCLNVMIKLAAAECLVQGPPEVYGRKQAMWIACLGIIDKGSELHKCYEIRMITQVTYE